jgi:MFS family permease
MRFFIGWLGDTFGRKRVYVATFVCHGLGIIAFAFVSPERFWLIPVYIVLFGIGHGGQHTMGMTVMADYFGSKRYATLRGLRQTLTLPSAILAPVFAGLMFDLNGSYRLAFVILGFIAMTAALWQYLIRRPFWDALPKPVMSGEPVPAGTEAVRH